MSIEILLRRAKRDASEQSAALLKPGQQSVATHEFTAHNPTNGRDTADAKRQSNYNDTLAAQDNLTVHKGQYLRKTQRCIGYGATWKAYEEKMTDVNIATHMLADAYEDRFDMTFINSGDGNLTTSTHQVRKRFPNKRQIVVFPPNRQSAQLKKAANGFLSIGVASESVTRSRYHR